jgi:hypothetical protein
MPWTTPRLRMGLPASVLKWYSDLFFADYQRIADSPSTRHSVIETDESSNNHNYNNPDFYLFFTRLRVRNPVNWCNILSSINHIKVSIKGYNGFHPPAFAGGLLACSVNLYMYYGNAKIFYKPSQKTINLRDAYTATTFSSGQTGKQVSGIEVRTQRTIND